MPDEIEIQIKEHLEAHRREGGAGFVLKHTNKLSDLVLWRAFINLNEKTIKITTIEEMGEAPETTFYEGAIVPGKHTISFILIFKEKGKIKESDPMWRVDGKIPISIDPKLEPKKVIKLVTNRDYPRGQIITRIMDGN